VCDRQDHREDAVVLAGGQIDYLPSALQARRQIVNANVLGDNDAEQGLVQVPREVELFETPVRGEPGSRDQEQDRLAARSRLVQRLFPALARFDAALGIEIEKDVVPALLGEPVAHGDCRGVVGARMADEQARHGRPRIRPLAAIRRLRMPACPAPG
jgi:hypothetical protein